MTSTRPVTARDFTARRDREASLITAVLTLPCGLACAGSVVPGLDDAVTTALAVLAVVALLAAGLRWVCRWVRERREDAADALTAARWRAAHAPHLLSRPTAPASTPHARRWPGLMHAPRCLGLMFGRWRDVAGHPMGPSHVAAHHHPARPRRGRGVAVVPTRRVHPRRPGRRAGRTVDHPPACPRMVLSGLGHLVVDPMSRTRRPAQGGLWGRHQPLPTGPLPPGPSPPGAGPATARSTTWT